MPGTAMIYHMTFSYGYNKKCISNSYFGKHILQIAIQINEYHNRLTSTVKIELNFFQT